MATTLMKYRYCDLNPFHRETLRHPTILDANEAITLEPFDLRGFWPLISMPFFTASLMPQRAT